MIVQTGSGNVRQAFQFYVPLSSYGVAVINDENIGSSAVVYPVDSTKCCCCRIAMSLCKTYGLCLTFLA